MLLFNRYEYNPQTDIAGKGECSRVYKATDTHNQETTALKIYRINELSDHYRAIKNARLILTIEHPGLCKYYDIQQIEKEDSFGEKETLQVCVTAFMGSGNLVDYYKKNNDPVVLQALLVNVLNGLSTLHKKGIIHGYLKPSNVLVTETNAGPSAGITDFAMGMAFEEASAGTGSHPLLSAASYLSPEQLNAHKYGVNNKISFNTDLWSLALVVYETLTGEPLLAVAAADFPETIIHRIAAFELPDKIKSVPEPFRKFLMLCLVKEAGSRATSVDDLLPLFHLQHHEPESILQLEEKLLPLPPSQTFAEDDTDTDVTRIIALPKTGTLPLVANTHADEETDDVTRVIARPVAGATTAAETSAGDETKVIALPFMSTAGETAQKRKDEDITQLIIRPASPDGADKKLVSEASEAEDDVTRVLIQPKKNEIVANVAEAGLPEPANHISANSIASNDMDDDATRVITALPSSAVDDTIILSKTNKEKQSTDAAVQKNIAAEQSLAAGNLKEAGNEENQTTIILKKRDKPVVLFNRYEYFPSSDLIGKGGFSRVYKAYDKRLSRWVALKIYKTGEFSDRYSPIAEIKRVVNLDHPNICRYLDIEEIENENPFGENEKIQVCVMELLDSGNFADYYKASKNPETLKKLIQDILNGLSYLHKNGIIHRDIKPANILIKQTIEGPVAKITDFGISKKSDTENNNSSSALIVSIPYMAPEQLNAKRYGINENISYNLDLWSLGVTIYEVVAGKVLFKNSDQDNSEQIMANIMAPELPEKLNDLPEPFRTIVSHCVIKNARERASRAEELMVLLNTAPAAANTATILASQAANVTADTEKKEAIISGKPIAENPVLPIPAAQPVPAELKINKPRFSIADEEEKPVKRKDESKNKSLLIVIGSAVILFILFIIFLNTRQQPVADTNAVATQKTDTGKKMLPVVPAADSTHSNTIPPEKKNDTIASQPAAAAVIAKPVHTTEKKKERISNEGHKKPVPQTEKPTGSSSSKYTLVLTAETDCTVKVDGMNYGEVQKGKPTRIYLPVGKHALLFTSSSNSTSVYTVNIDVKPENIGLADKFRVPLK